MSWKVCLFIVSGQAHTFVKDVCKHLKRYCCLSISLGERKKVQFPTVLPARASSGRNWALSTWLFLQWRGDKSMERIWHWSWKMSSMVKVRCPWCSVGTADTGIRALNHRAYCELYSVRPRRTCGQSTVTEAEDTSNSGDESSDTISTATNTRLFTCPEERCVKRFMWNSSLVKHLVCRKHKFALEHETLYDKAIIPNWIVAWVKYQQS